MFASLSGVTAVLLQVLGLAGLVGLSTPPKTPAATPVFAYQSVCTNTDANAACLAKVRRDSRGKFEAAASPKALPAGYSPQQFRSAYGLGPTTTGTGSIAVITAYDNPYAASDLNKFDTTFGLPAFPSCTTASQTGCFTKMSQTGSTTFMPFSNRGWALEADLDVQIAHSMCPGCRLTLVEANSNSFANLSAAIDRAVAIGAHVVSMSWGGSEFNTETNFDSHFNPASVNFVAASGDNGYGTGWPSASGKVISAGGTSLHLDANGNRSSETVWSGTGSGCSLYESKPSWQADTSCKQRTENDLSADADPNTGAAIYSGYSPYGSGWFVIGGTSLSTPLIAGLVADAGAPAQAAALQSLYSAQGSANLYDVISGNDGSCSVSYYCTAKSGYDGPSGVGAPAGPGAF